jgi:membrane protease YdiL (CAAX protease family)
MAVVVEGGLGLLAVAVAWLFAVPLREQLPSTYEELRDSVARGVLAGAIMLILFFWVAFSSLPALQRLREHVEWIVAEIFPNASLAQFALVAALAGVGEELLFRGVLQTLVSWLVGPVAALVVGGLVFGIFHALSKLYFIFATLIGLALGWMVFRYHDLLAPMLAHAIYDFVAISYVAHRNARRAA